MATKKSAKKAPIKPKKAEKSKAKVAVKKDTAAKAVKKPVAKTAKKAPEDSAKPGAVQEQKYDNVPYESYAYPQTHPEHLYTISTLFKLKPKMPEKARVLELGCAGGGNLIPFAIANPKAKCLGLDISSTQIAVANEHAKALKLKNIEFRHEDVSKIDYDLGQFDYIICHGVYSWVPKKVRDAILNLCERCLSDDGLAVISYNTLPGWNAVRSLRDMMLYHTRMFETPAEKVREARALLNFLHANAPGNNESYRQIIDQERTILGTNNDSYVYHDHLEQENNQFYLHEFIEQAADFDLAYVGDTSITTMYIGNFNPKVQETLRQIPEMERQEQYIDFLINRRFRHSILTKAKNKSKINRGIDQKVIFDYYVSAMFEAAEDAPGQGTTFRRTGSQETLQATNPMAVKLLTNLAKLGKKPVKPDEVIKTTAKEEGMKDDGPLRKLLSESGIKLALQGFLTLHSAPLDYATEVSKKPRAYALARYQANLPHVTKVTTITRQSVTLDAFSRALLNHLDGRNDFKALIARLKEHVDNGDLTIKHHGQPIKDVKKLEEVIETYTKSSLEKMVIAGLLEA